MGFGMVGVEPDRPPVMGLSFAQTAERPQDIADVAVEVRDAVIARDRLADQFNGKVVASALVGDDAQQMQGAGMVRIDRKDLPVKALGLIEAAGLM